MSNFIKKTLVFIITLFCTHHAIAREPQAKFATVDWSVAETLLALGAPPLAVGDVQSYQTWVMEPKLP